MLLFSPMTQNEFFILQGGRMSRSGLRQLMTTQQMKIQASYLAKYGQVSTLAFILKYVKIIFRY